MQTVSRHVPLHDKTTLGVGGAAEYYVPVTTHEELEWARQFACRQQLPLSVLGGGSNVLVPDAGVPGVVLAIKIPGVTVTQETDTHVYVRVGAGVGFDTFVAEAVERGWWGLENLSAIPGLVGAVPVQNVGAYGVEVAAYIAAVETVDLQSGVPYTFRATECQFGYRDSFFKTAAGRVYAITHVTFRLGTRPQPQLAYGALASLPATVSAAEIRRVVCTIRAEKFPDWHTVGTAGSFFKNPVVTRATGADLSARYPELPTYAVDAERVKLSLGWILDKICGLRGYAHGPVRLYEKQALVLVCERGTHASAVDTFATEVAARVLEATGITIEREVSAFTSSIDHQLLSPQMRDS